MAVDNSRRNTTPPRPNLPPEGQPWGRWVTDTLNDLKLETGGVKREVISSNKNHNAQLQMSAQQKREIVKVNLKAEEALNIALAASGSTTIYFVAPETPEQGDIWYENVTGIWFRWVDDQWVPITDETLLEALEAILAQRIANDDKIRTFAQPDAPTGMTAEYVGDLWYDTDDKNKLYRWDGIEWVPIRDAGITEAQDAADAAQGTADDAKTVADDAKETADTAADVVTQLEAQVTADLGDMQGRLVTAEGELTDLTTNVLPGLTGALDDVQGDLSDHATRMTAAEQAVAAAEGRLVTAEGELATLTDTTLPALDTRLGSAETAVSAAEGRLTDAEGELATLDSDLSQIDTALSALQTDVDNLVIPSVDGLNKITYSTSAPSATAGYKEGDTWFRYTGTGASRVIYGQWHFTGSAWNVVALRNEMIASLDAGKVTTGFLDAARIDAGSITAEKLVIQPGNIFPDPFFLDTAKWGGTNVEVTTDSNMPGGNVLQIESTTAQRGSYYGASSDQFVQLVPGAKYLVRARARISGATGSPVRAYFRGLNAAGSTVTNSSVLIPTGAPLTGTDPEQFETEITVSESLATPVAVGFYTSYPYSAGTIYRVNDVSVQRMAGATLIEDGAITTGKVAAEAITGNKIKAGSITATDAVFGTGAIQNADIGNLNASKINAGTLDAARIGANTIDATKISSYNLTTANATIGNAVVKDAAIASLNASKINAGELDAARIGANSITADKLIIGSSENLIPNGAGEAGATVGWATSLTWDTSDKPSGETGSFKSGANSSYQATYDSWDVEPGKPYRFEVWLKADKPNSRMYIEIRNQDGAHGGLVTTIPGEANAGSGGYPVSNQLVPTTWTKYAGIWTPNAGSTRVRMGNLYFNHSNGTERGAVQRIAGMRLKPMTGATLIENGSITTGKVAAEAITGSKIKAGSITASDAIFANAAIKAADIASINADTITVGTLRGIDISGVTITGNTTVASGGGITSMGDISVLDANGVTPRFTATNWGIRMMSPRYNARTGAPSPHLDGIASIWIPTEERGGTGYQADWNSLILETGIRESPAMSSLHVGRSTGTPNGGKMIMGAAASRMASRSMYGNSLVIADMGIMPPPERNQYDPTEGGIFFAVNGRAAQGYAESPRILPPAMDYSTSSPLPDQRMEIYKADIGPGFIDSEDRTIKDANIQGVYGDGAEESGRFFGRQFGGATRSSDQNLSTTSTTTIVLNSTSGFSSRGVSLSGGGLTVAHGGYYVVEAAVQFDGYRSNYWRALAIQVNGSTRRSQPSIASGDSRMANTTAAFELDAGDKVTLATNGSSSSTGMSVHANVSLTITRVGA